MSIDVEDFKKKFEPMIVQEMTAAKVPGSAFTIFKDGTIIYSRGFGSRNLSKFLPYTPDTVNGFGSNSKSFTALGILLLQEEGKLSIEDPISKYLPITLGKENQPIKIKHLLSHSSGIPNLGHGEILITQSDIGTGLPLIPYSSWEDVFLHTNGANSEIRYNPGEHFFYLNSGYMLLGEIIARTSTLTYEDFIKEKIIKKIGMERTGFTKKEFENDTNISVPYYSDPKLEGHPKPTPGTFPYNKFIYPAGGLLSTVNQMAKYIMMMMDKGKYNGQQLFDSRIINELTTGRINTSSYNKNQMYCYGWSREDNFLGDTLISHSGGITGGISYMAYLEKAKIGITAISNFPPGPIEQSKKAFCLLLSKSFEEIFPQIKRNKLLSKLAGNYSTYKGIKKGKILFEGGSLFFSNEELKMKIPLYPKTNDQEELQFYIHLPSRTLDLDFELATDETIHFTLERDLFHKIQYF